MREKTCSSCGAAMLMVPTKASAGEREMPLDKVPTPAGNVLILPDGMATVLGGPLRQKAEDEGSTLYTSHHYTCPQGSMYRRKRRG